MRIVFFGTPDYVVPIADKLHKAFRGKLGEEGVVAVVTQKPKPVGRRQIMEYSPIDDWAHKKDIKILRDLDIKEIPPADVGILASYGNLIPQEVIKNFPNGILVVHPSLLPQFRWASPIPAAIVTDTNPTGVSIIKMDDKWDHGPIVTSFKEDVGDNDTFGSLRENLFARSADVLVDALPAYVSGKIKLKPQDDSKASYARMIKKEDGFIPPKYLEMFLQGSEPCNEEWNIDFIKDFSLVPNPHSLERFIRAMDPWPGAWTEIKLGSDKVIKRLKILKAHIEPTTHNTPNAKQKLVLDEVQLEGRNITTWKQFTEGYPNFTFT